MFVKFNQIDSIQLEQYILENEGETIYFKKPIEEFKSGNSQGHFYGYLESGKILGLFYFSNKNSMLIHYKDTKVLGNLSLLKAIKQHKPKYIKGKQDLVNGIYKLICRSITGAKETISLLMKYERSNIEAIQLKGFKIINGENAFTDEMIKDMRFFIDVENHFGRNVKAINDILKEFKELLSQGNYMIVLKGDEIIGQGIVEEETNSQGILAGIYVAPKYRRQSVGEMISRMLTDVLIKRGKAPFLFVISSNDSAKLLYEKIGYKPIENYSILTIEY